MDARDARRPDGKQGPDGIYASGVQRPLCPEHPRNGAPPSASSTRTCRRHRSQPVRFARFILIQDRARAPDRRAARADLEAIRGAAAFARLKRENRRP